MANQREFRSTKKKGSAWKAWLIVVLVLAVLVVSGYIFRQELYNFATETVATWLTGRLGGAGEDEIVIFLPQGIFDPTEPDEPLETEPAEPVESPTEATIPDYGETGKIINILLIGQDSRAGEESKLADTIMLLTLNKEKKTVTATSFPRDTYVKLPNMWGHTCGWNRINTAYALGYSWMGNEGAMEMMNVTLKNNFGVNVQHDVEVSFDAFYTVVDRLGFLQIELYGDELDYMNKCSSDLWWGSVFVEGENDLYDVAALEYVRMRHSNNADNDLKRQERQRKVVQQIVDKLRKLNPMELSSLIDDVLGMVLTNIPADEMKLYIKECLPYLFEISIVSNQCPAPGTYWGEMKELPDGLGGVLRFDEQANKRLMAEICEG